MGKREEESHHIAIIQLTKQLFPIQIQNIIMFYKAQINIFSSREYQKVEVY